MAKEIKQKTFVLRIDSRRMEAIEKWAADEFRSVNGQLLYIIDQALKKSRRMQNEGGAISPPGRKRRLTDRTFALRGYGVRTTA